MQDLVGIVRQEAEMQQALEKIAALKLRAAKAGISGNREYNTGWHTALDLDNLLTVSEIVTKRRARAQGKPRRTISRRLSRKERGVGKIQSPGDEGSRRRPQRGQERPSSRFRPN